MSEQSIQARLRQQLGFEPHPAVSETSLVQWLLAFHVGTLAFVLVPGLSDLTPVRAMFVFFDLTFVPGILFLVAIGEFDLNVDRGLYAVGASLILVMATGAILNITLPIIGIDGPLAIPFLVAGTTVLIGGLGVLAYRQANERRDPVSFERVLARKITPIVPFLLLLLPATVIAIAVLNGYEENLPIIVVLSAIAITPLLMILADRSEWYPLGIWGIAVALLYHSTLSSQAHGGSSIPMHIMQVDRWTPGVVEVASTSTSLIPNGVLYPTYATLIGVPYYIQTSFVNPLIVSLLPVILFQVYRRYVGDATALLGAFVFMFAHPFYRLYPGGGRVATPVFFLALVGLLVADDGLGATSKKVLSLMFASGIVVSHYGTSYYAMLAIFGAYALLWVLPTLERLLESVSRRGQAASREIVQFTTERDGTPVLTASFVGFFGVLVLAWYMYTSVGNHFSLPRHIYWSVLSLYEGSFLTGSTASRVQKSYGYGTASIRLSRFIYIGLMALMSIGLLSELIRRLSPSSKTQFQDEYLAVSVTFLTFAGSSFLLPVGWGGGRPMMIAFTFLGVFAAVGALTLSRWCWRTIKKYSTNSALPSEVSADRLAHTAFAVVLLGFLLLNTGVMAATAVGGSAPMNVPIQSEFDQRENPEFRARAYVDTDVQTHAWLLNHRSNEYGIRGDLIANGQTDKYRSSIALAMEDDVVFPYSTSKPRGFLNRIGEANRTEYVLILGHNLHLNAYTLNSTYERRPLDPINDELESRNRIYSTGDSVIYFGGNRTTSDRTSSEIEP